MTITILCYPPGAGGNHVKNIMTTDVTVANSAELDVSVYQPGQPEVQSLPGRNLNAQKISNASACDGWYVLHGHFGELAAWANDIRDWSDVRWLILTIDQDSDRTLLRNRQMRLGQHGHSWYLDEEQPWLYQPELCARYFGADRDRITTISITELWHPKLDKHNIIHRLEFVTPGRIDRDTSQRLHSIWWDNNFRFDFCSYERELYGQTHNHA